MIALTLVVFAGATALVIRAILRDRRELKHWQAERVTAESMIAYHAWRSRQIRDGLDALGDEVLQHVFPLSLNGR